MQVAKLNIIIIVCRAKNYNVHTYIVSTFARNPVYTILNSCNFVIHRTDMYLTIQIQHNTVVYVHPTSESTALMMLARQIARVLLLYVQSAFTC
jgi:hypothetical protein